MSTFLKQVYKKKVRREGNTRFSPYNSQLSGYFTKADDGVEVVEQQVDQTHGVNKNIFRR